jgi:hypothetical protein
MLRKHAPMRSQTVTCCAKTRTGGSQVAAPDPCPTDVFHPSMRGAKSARMGASLSSCEFRAYRKATGFYVLYLRSILLLSTNVSFSTFAYLKNVTGELRLPGSPPILIDGIGVSEQCAIRHDGKTLPVDLFVSVQTRMRDLSACLAHLDLRFCFSFHGAVFESRIRKQATIRAIRTSRPPASRMT